MRRLSIKWGIEEKTFWDFMQLLLLPILISLSGIMFQWRQQQIASDRYREEALQKYYDDISELMFQNELKDSRLGDEVSSLARAKTLTLLQKCCA